MASSLFLSDPTWNQSNWGTDTLSAWGDSQVLINLWTGPLSFFFQIIRELDFDHHCGSKWTVSSEILEAGHEVVLNNAGSLCRHNLVILYIWWSVVKNNSSNTVSQSFFFFFFLGPDLDNGKMMRSNRCCFVMWDYSEVTDECTSFLHIWNKTGCSSCLKY